VSVADIFDEVEEDLRGERSRAFLLRYGGWVLVCGLIIALVAGAWEAMNWRRQQATSQLAIAYLAAMQDTNRPAPAGQHPGASIALGRFAQIATAPAEGYRTLARLQAAGLHAQAGDIAAAEAMWRRVMADDGADPALRDLARLLSVEQQLDTGEPAALSARLQPLMAPGNAWMPLAMEAQAMLDLRQGHTPQARATLQTLVQDAAAPRGVRQRAEAMLTRLAATPLTH
jgi:hypothetical protein